MSLVVLSPDFPPGRGGIQRLAGEFVAALRRDDVRVVALRSGADARGADAAQVLRVPLGPAVDQRLRVIAYNAVALAAALFWRPSALVVTHIVASPAARIWSKITRRPYILILHGQELGHRPKLMAAAVRGSAATVAVSRHTKHEAERLGADAGKIAVVNPGVDTSGIAAASRARREREKADRGGSRSAPSIVTVARLVDRYKGHDVMLEALDLLRERVPGVTWHVVGDGPLRAELEAEAARRDLAANVVFHGAVEDAERDRLMAEADLFAMPSRTTPSGGGEGFGLVYLEAAAAGLPVVAGAVAGALDAVRDGDTGLLVDPTDATAVADALESLLCDPPRLRAMSLSALSDAAERDWSSFADGVMRLIESPPDRRVRVVALSHTGLLGGAERSLLAQLVADRDAGATDPLLVAPSGPLADRAESLGIEVVTVDEFDPKFASSWRALPSLALAGFAQARAVARAAKRHQAELVHANSPRAGIVAVAARPLGGPPVVTHVRDCLPSSGRGVVVRRIVDLGSRRVVANSRHTASDFSRAPGVESPAVVYNPLDARFEQPTAGRDAAAAEKRISVVGQITPWKRQDTAIRVLAALSPEHPGLVLDVAGSVKFRAGSHDNAAYHERLAELADELGVAERVNFLGEVEDVAVVFSRSEVVLVPSTEEPFGRVAIEAMATGTAVVATSVGGPREFVEHGANGLLADPDDLAEWIACTRALLEDDAMREELGSRAQLDVSRRFVGGSPETSMRGIYMAATA